MRIILSIANLKFPAAKVLFQDLLQSRPSDSCSPNRVLPTLDKLS